MPVSPRDRADRRRAPRPDYSPRTVTSPASTDLAGPRGLCGESSASGLRFVDFAWVTVTLRLMEAEVSSDGWNARMISGPFLARASAEAQGEMPPRREPRKGRG